MVSLFSKSEKCPQPIAGNLPPRAYLVGSGLDGVKEVVAHCRWIDSCLCSASSSAVVAAQDQVLVATITLRWVILDLKITFQSRSLANDLAIHDCTESTLVEDVRVMLKG